MTDITSRIQITKILPSGEDVISVPLLEDESVSLIEVRSIGRRKNTKWIIPLVPISASEWSTIKRNDNWKGICGRPTCFYEFKNKIFMFPANYKETKIEIILEKKGSVENKYDRFQRIIYKIFRLTLLWERNSYYPCSGINEFIFTKIKNGCKILGYDKKGRLIFSISFDYRHIDKEEQFIENWAYKRLKYALICFTKKVGK